MIGTGLKRLSPVQKYVIILIYRHYRRTTGIRKFYVEVYTDCSAEVIISTGSQKTMAHFVGTDGRISQ